MAYPDQPQFIDFVDERTEPAQIEDEEHSIQVGDVRYSLNEVPDTEYSISCTGSVHGTYTVSFTDNAPGSGCVYVNPLNGNVLHCSIDAPDDLVWAYWGRGTANNKRMLEQYREPIVDVHVVARQFWVAATHPVSQGVLITEGNCQIGGKLVQYNGGARSFASMTFDNPGYFKAVRLAIDSSAAVTHSEGSEAASRSSCEDPPSIPESKTLAVIYVQDGQNILDEDIVNTFIEVPCYTGDGGGGGTGGGGGGSGSGIKMRYAPGVVSGDTVYLVSANTVDKADADDDSRVPAKFVVENILDETYCTVKSPGSTIDFTGKDTTPGAMTPGASYYLNTSAGYITPTRNQVPGEWDQEVGLALSSTKLLIICGPATRNVEGGGGGDPGPDGVKFKYDSGVGEAEFVYLKADCQTLDEAKGNSGDTMPAIGIVDSIIDSTWAVTRNNYYWKTGEHSGKTPGNLSPGSPGDVFYVSVTTEGQASASQSLNPEHYVQVACKQIDSGTVFLICCGPAKAPESDNPDDGYDMGCDSEVAVGSAVYIGSDGIAHRTNARDDGKKDAVGIVGAVNGDNTRCTIIRPPNVFNPGGSYPQGEHFLNPSGEAGSWTLGSNILWCPGDWKVRIGWGRGSSLSGLLVDIKNYGKFGDPGEDDGGDDNGDPTKDRQIGLFLAYEEIEFGRWVQAAMQQGYVGLCTNSNAAPMRGVVLGCEYDTQSLRWLATVLMRGWHSDPSRSYDDGSPYFASTNGYVVPAVKLGRYRKQVGVGGSGGRIFVDPQPSDYLDVDTGDPIPVYPFTAVPDDGDLQPAPVGNPYERLRGHDGTNSGSPIVGNFTADEWLLEVPTVIPCSDFFIESTGVGSGAYLECDLVTGSGTSILTTKAKLEATGDGTRGDTVPSSANAVGHTRAVVDMSKMPLPPGTTLYWKYTLQGTHTTEPYGCGMVAKKYTMSIAI